MITDPRSPFIPADLDDAERARLPLARPGVIIALTQLDDGRFDIHGNHAVVCPDCRNLFIGEAWEIRAARSAHMFNAHGIEEGPILPRA